ncbi:MAG TPA: pyrimidine/purine nucleoside phosphorylase [Chitinophagales bacterium]|nr:pyrimidine/purine nucleoside phosphorylase [Chitinophagales bacterium]
MIAVNEYFDGKVKSLAFNSASGATTVGVMKAGEYTFNTGKKELITIVSGSLTVKISGMEEWELFEPGESFEVEANSSFDLIVFIDTAYLCQFIG